MCLVVITVALLACSGLVVRSELGPHEGPVSANLKRPVRARAARLSLLAGPIAPEPAITKAQCTDVEHGGPVAGPDCITDTLACGDSVVGHTLGGVDRYDSEFWARHACWPGIVNHDSGGERVYQLHVPEGEWRVFVWLDSPCADLDLMAVEAHSSGSCPQMSSIVPRCEAALVEGARQEHIELVNQGAAGVWYLVVEGRGEAEGAFGLQVECHRGVR